MFASVGLQREHALRWVGTLGKLIAALCRQVSLATASASTSAAGASASSSSPSPDPIRGPIWDLTRSTVDSVVYRSVLPSALKPSANRGQFGFIQVLSADVESSARRSSIRFIRPWS